MIDWDDTDQVLNVVGIAIVGTLVLSLALLVFAAISIQQESAAVPSAEWELTRVNDSSVRITYRGGDSVMAANLSVNVDGRERRIQWPNTTVRDGDSALVHVETPGRITLIWESPSTGSETLKRWQLSGTPGTGNDPTDSRESGSLAG